MQYQPKQNVTFRYLEGIFIEYFDRFATIPSLIALSYNINCPLMFQLLNLY